MSDSTVHVSVMPDEVLEMLAPQPGQCLVDGTAGGGGHLRRMAEAVEPDGWVLGVDRDPDVMQRLERELAGLPVKLAWGNFADIPSFLNEIECSAVDGVLLDLGLSSDQLADERRGFSFNIDGPLDLRFNPESGEPASRLIQRLSGEHLADLIYQYGEERYSRRVARAIVAARRSGPIETSRQLAELVRRAIPSRSRDRDRIDPATRTFQALRIAVNRELESLEQALAKLPDVIRVGGRLAVISFHSLEDRRVKDAFRDTSIWKRMNKKPIIPSDVEIARNPRSRSAKLRVAERVSADT